MKKDFWQRDLRWPIDPVGWVFLARAYHLIGEAKYGVLWTGKEPYAEKPLALERLDKEAAWLHPDEPIKQRQYVDSRLAAFSEEDKATLLTLNRHFETCFLIAKYAESGDLSMGYRPTTGGKIHPLPAHAWGTSKKVILLRFYVCRILPHNLYAEAMAGENDAQLFVHENSLKKFQESVTSSSTSDGNVTPPPKSKDSQAPLKSSAASVQRRGRHTQYDWGSCFAHLDKLFEHHGELSDDDPEWKVQADVERAVSAFFEEKFGQSPSESRVRDKVLEYFEGRQRPTKADK